LKQRCFAIADDRASFQLIAMLVIEVGAPAPAADQRQG
jgi:hypothetical protein